MEDFTLKVRTIVEVLLVPIMGFGVMLLSDMNKNIVELNTKVAVILVDSSHSKEKIREIEQRLRELEKGVK